jgi:hypothetical protein
MISMLYAKVDGRVCSNERHWLVVRHQSENQPTAAASKAVIGAKPATVGNDAAMIACMTAA